MQKIPSHLKKAELIRRLNRFVAEVSIDGRAETVYVPNTGRLSELALPGAEVLLSPLNGKFRYRILYIISDDYPVMIDSTYSNRLFHDLLIERRVPGLENFTGLKREPVYGNHRFDFLIEQNGEERFLELKSCTLFHETTASFPDAVSDRASEHVKLLAETGVGEIVFFVLKDGMKKFIPNYHTDFTFYETLKNCGGSIRSRALSVRYNEDLRIEKLTEIPVVIPDVRPRGIFMLILRNTEQPGPQKYLLLCGKDETDVFSRIKKIKSSRKQMPAIPGIDFTEFKIISDLPVISDNTDLSILDMIFSGNGNHGKKIFVSDEWRIYSFDENPAKENRFWDMILTLRFGNL